MRKNTPALLCGLALVSGLVALSRYKPAPAAPDTYIYSTYQGIGVRTHKVTGKMEFGRPEGWRPSLRAKTRSYNH